MGLFGLTTSEALSGLTGIANFGLSLANYNRMGDWQKKTWRREDTAVQRRVADLKAAGLSPTLAAGSAASSSGPIRLDAPQMENKWVEREQMRKQREVMDAGISNTNSDTLNKILQGVKFAMEGRTAELTNFLKEGELRMLGMELDRFKREEEYLKDHPGEMPWMRDSITQFARGIENIINRFFPKGDSDAPIPGRSYLPGEYLDERVKKVIEDVKDKASYLKSHGSAARAGQMKHAGEIRRKRAYVEGKDLSFEWR